MRNVIGQAVSGDDFFDRPQLVNKIRRAIRNGNQIYLSAPRRVGKTSIMNYLMDNPGENEQFVYAITQSFRELMHNRKLTNKVQFVITGSIGLQPLVQKLAASDLINQLQFIDVPPLSEDEACTLFRQLIAPEGIEIDDETIRFILNKIDWLMPFHVQLLVQEVIDMYDSVGNPIDQPKAEKAFEQVFHQRNKRYFVEYYERLTKRLEAGAETAFVHEVLTRTANENTLERAVVHDLAVKHSFMEHYKATMESLLYDGYLHETPDALSYRFNSTILKTWWKKYVS